MQGMVTMKSKGLFKVKDHEGEFLCSLRGTLLREYNENRNLVAVGDDVDFQATSANRGVITSIHERKTVLARRGAGPRGRYHQQVVAANIQQAVLVFAVKEPPYKLNSIERYLVAARSQDIEPIVCFNKVDLGRREEAERDGEVIRKNGSQVIYTSIITGEGMEILQGILKDHLSLFAGSSGVGKTSIINMLEKQERGRTKEVSRSSGKGRHTTTAPSIYELPGGGLVVDTPGMREFGVWDGEQGIKKQFKDIEDLARYCHFSDCTHTHEPRCRVKAALENGEIDPRQLENYLKLIKEL